MESDEPIATVGDVFDLVNGFAFKSADFVESGIPVIKIKNVKAGEFSEQGFSYVGEKFLDKRRDKLARIGDLLISMSGNRHDGSPQTWVGKVAYFNKPGRYFINQRVGALRPKQGVEVDLKFAAYVLASMSYQEHFIAVATSSGGQANLSPTQILGAPLYLPCYEEQHEIGRLISALDDRIDLLRKTNTTLEAIAQALFKSWFVDFDPVHAKAKGREPEAMDAATAALFPSEFEDSELGPIPKGWRSLSFGDAAALSKGTVNPLSMPNTEFEHYSLPAFDAQQMPVHEAGEAIKSNKTLVPSGAVLVSKLNPHIPRIWPVGDVGANAVCSTEFLVWTPKPPASTVFVYCLASSRAFNSAMRQLVTGTSNSHQRVKPDQLEGIQVCVVSDAALKAFATIASPLLQRMLDNRQQAATLATLRDTLLPHLISGKPRLHEATETIEVALT